jgi:hypothetical protein
MNQIQYYPFMPVNQVTISKGNLALEAKGEAANVVAEAAAFALYCAGVALIIKAFR